MSDLLSQMEKKTKKINKKAKKDIQESLASSLQNSLTMLIDAKDFGKRELEALSYLYLNPFLFQYVFYEIKNKKHIKRKSAEDAKEFVKMISKAIASEYSKERERNLLDRMFGRKKNKIN